MKKEGKILDHGLHPVWGEYVHFLLEPIWEYDVEEKLLEKFPELHESETIWKLILEKIGFGLSLGIIVYAMYLGYDGNINLHLLPFFYLVGAIVLVVIIGGFGNPLVIKYALTESHVLFKMKYAFFERNKAIAFKDINRLYFQDHYDGSADVWFITNSNVKFTTYSKDGRIKHDFPRMERVFDYDFPHHFIREKVAMNRK